MRENIGNKTGVVTERLRPSRRTDDTPTSRAPSGFMRIEEAAAFLGCKVCFLRRLVAERRIPYYKPGKYLLFDRNDLIAWVRRFRVDPV